MTNITRARPSKHTNGTRHARDADAKRRNKRKARRAAVKRQRGR